MKKGFTLIELMVVISIISALTGGGVASFAKFNQRETVRNAAQEVKSTLRLAQSKAMAGEKGTICQPNQTLDGWCVDFSRNKMYGHCGGIEEGAYQNFNFQDIKLPSGVTLTFYSPDGSSCTNCAILRFLPNPYTGIDKAAIICLSGFGKKYKIGVTTVGEIADDGFVDNCP